jgi:L-asparaginase II
VKPAFLGSSDGSIVAELVRDGVVESLHSGIVAVVDAAGKLLLETGNSEAIVYPRSTLKPLQTIAVLNTGVDLTPQEIVLTTASHCGSLEHRNAVQGFLERHGLDSSDLQCPLDWPLGAQERAEMQQRAGAPNRLAMNCSGKHAGFLAAAQHAGYSLENYLEPTHPLQADIFKTIEEWSHEKVAFSSTDGCGAPLHALSVAGLARAIAQVGSGHTPAARQLVEAVSAHPWAIDGHGRANTLTIEKIGGIAKIGAEGLVVIGTPEGVAVAVKIIDGSMRATTPVALEALVQVGAIEPAVRDDLVATLGESVMGGDRIIGGLRVRL